MDMVNETTNFNEIQKLITTRRTVHRFSSKPLPEASVRRALRCAITAPNHKLTNPWRFIRVGPDIRDKLEDLYIQIKSQSKQLSSDDEAELRRKVGDPPELVVLVQKLADDSFRRGEDYAAIACAVENAMLSLWSEGIFSKWGTGGLTRHEKTYGMLPVDSEDERIIGFLWIGYPRADHRDNPKPGRIPLDDVVRHTE